MMGFARDVNGRSASELEGGKACCGTEDQLRELTWVREGECEY